MLLGPIMIVPTVIFDLQMTILIIQRIYFQTVEIVDN